MDTLVSSLLNFTSYRSRVAFGTGNVVTRTTRWFVTEVSRRLWLLIKGARTNQAATGLKDKGEENKDKEIHWKYLTRNDLIYFRNGRSGVVEFINKHHHTRKTMRRQINCKRGSIC